MFITDSVDTQLDDLLARICEELQLPASMRRQAEERYHSIGDWLSEPGTRLASASPKIYPQGSLSIGTTVKPLAREEFDLDLVCELQLDPRRILNPLELLAAVEARLKERGIYDGMLEMKNRCVRVNYANEFHMDILPAAPDSGAPAGSLVVPDREAKAWKASNPKGYAAWFNGRAALVKLAREAFAKHVEPLPQPQSTGEMESLRLVVQLLKRWRDVAYKSKPEHAPISIVLTTLAGHSYEGEASVNRAISGVLDKIVYAIDLAAPRRLVVRNPTNAQEDFSERWDDDLAAYTAFTAGIKDLQTRWKKLQASRGMAPITKELEALFGDKITKSAMLKQADAISKARSGGVLRVLGATGGLTGSLATPARSIAVPKNTFYGG